jgi:hypothetical protein
MEEISMSLGWVKKFTIKNTTEHIISGIIKEVGEKLRINPELTLEETLRLVDKEMPIRLPGEENLKNDLYSLFSMMVMKVYRYKHASDRDAASEDHTKLVIKISHDYMDMIISKSKR